MSQRVVFCASPSFLSIMFRACGRGPRCPLSTATRHASAGATPRPWPRILPRLAAQIRGAGTDNAFMKHT